MTEIRRNLFPGLLGGLPRIEWTPETARRLTGKLRMTPDSLMLSTDGEPEEKPAEAEDKPPLPDPKEAIAPVQQANTVVSTVQDIAKTTTASGKALANVTKAVSAPIEGRHLGLRDAVIEGNESGVVAAVAADTPIAQGIGIYNNVLKGGVFKKWEQALETNSDPNADLSDRALANLSAVAGTADTYNAVQGFSKTSAEYLKKNWVEANRSLSKWGDVASFSGQATKDTVVGFKQAVTEFPEKIIEGLKGNRGGVADLAVKAASETAQEAGKEAVKEAAAEVAKEAGKGLAQEAGKEAAKQAAEEGTKLAFKTSRFAMGLNIACAAYDVLHAGKVIGSEKKGLLQKGLAVTTAIGSVIAATNIPGISQAGAAISFATSVAEAAVDKKEKPEAEPTKSSISWSTVA